jgi:phi LC3 family holin
MKINWKARFKNKAFVLTFVTLVITFIYQILGIFGVVPSISEDSVKNIITIGINLLATIGVLIDPTTPGTSDSDRAMTYYTENDVRTDE